MTSSTMVDEPTLLGRARSKKKWSGLKMRAARRPQARSKPAEAV